MIQKVSVALLVALILIVMACSAPTASVPTTVPTAAPTSVPTPAPVPKVKVTEISGPVYAMSLTDVVLPKSFGEGIVVKNAGNYDFGNPNINGVFYPYGTSYTIDAHSLYGLIAIWVKSDEAVVLVNPGCHFARNDASNNYIVVAAKFCEWQTKKEMGMVFLHIKDAVAYEGWNGNGPFGKDGRSVSEGWINADFLDNDSLEGYNLLLPPNRPEYKVYGR